MKTYKYSEKRILSEDATSLAPAMNVAQMFQAGRGVLARGLLKAGGALAVGYILDSAVSEDSEFWLANHAMELDQATQHLQLAVAQCVSQYDDEGNLRMGPAFEQANPRFNYRTLLQAMGRELGLIVDGEYAPTYRRLLRADYHRQFGKLVLPHRVGIVFLKAVCLNSKAQSIFLDQMKWENIQGPSPQYTQCASSKATCMLTTWGLYYEALKNEINIAKSYVRGLTPRVIGDIERTETVEEGSWDESCFLDGTGPATVPAPEPEPFLSHFLDGDEGATTGPPEMAGRVAKPNWEEIETCRLSPPVERTTTERGVVEENDGVDSWEKEEAQFQLDQCLDGLEAINETIIRHNRAVASTAPLVGIVDSAFRGWWNNTGGELLTLIPGVENEDVLSTDECGKLPASFWRMDDNMVTRPGHWGPGAERQEANSSDRPSRTSDTERRMTTGTEDERVQSARISSQADMKMMP